MKPARLLVIALTLVLTLMVAVAAMAATGAPALQAPGGDEAETQREMQRSLEAEAGSAQIAPSRQPLAPLSSHEGPLFVGVDDVAIPAYRIDVDTGVATPAFSGAQVWGAAYDPAGDRVLFTTGSTLWEWPVGGAPAPVITITIGGATASMVGFAFYDGVLYGSRNIGTESIYAIDTTTGAATEAITFAAPVGERDFGGIDIDPETGKLYATNDAAALQGLVEIAPDGTVTLVTAYPPGQTDIDGLAVGSGNAYLVTDEPGDIFVYNFASGAYITPIANPWTTSEVFSAGAWIDPAQRQLVCSQPALAIPDNNVTGARDDLEIPINGSIVDLNVVLDVTHTWVGDLSFSLEHVDTGTLVTFFNRPGVPASTFGCSGNNILATINDEGTDGNVETTCLAGTPTIAGHRVGGDPPNSNLLASFDGEDLAGTWRLRAVDAGGGDTGTVEEWCVSAIVDPPVVEVSPPQLDSTQPAGSTVTQTLEIGNSGAGNLDWSLSVGSDATCSGDLPWLSTAPITGSTAAGGSSDVTVSFDASGLGGDYEGFLCVASGDPETPLVAVPVAMTVEQFNLYLPLLRK